MQDVEWTEYHVAEMNWKVPGGAECHSGGATSPLLKRMP